MSLSSSLPGSGTVCSAWSSPEGLPSVVASGDSTHDRSAESAPQVRSGSARPVHWKQAILQQARAQDSAPVKLGASPLLVKLLSCSVRLRTISGGLNRLGSLGA